MKTIFKNLLQAVGVICYFIVLDFAYTRMDIERLSRDIEFFAGVFLALGILLLEKSYKKDSGKIAITGIELLCLSFHSLSIMHFITILECEFRFYLIASSISVATYYILKGIIIYTKEKKEYLNTLSDISEIVKEDEPIKKEAKKRNKETITERVNQTKDATTKNKSKKVKATGELTNKKSKSIKTAKEIKNKETKNAKAIKKTTKNTDKKEAVKQDKVVKKKVKTKKEGKEND